MEMALAVVAAAAADRSFLSEGRAKNKQQTRAVSLNLDQMSIVSGLYTTLKILAILGIEILQLYRFFILSPSVLPPNNFKTAGS